METTIGPWADLGCCARTARGDRRSLSEVLCFATPFNDIMPDTIARTVSDLCYSVLARTQCIVQRKNEYKITTCEMLLLLNESLVVVVSQHALRWRAGQIR